MNPERPKDPREQMEVRITALLLGEASAFEEAELLEAIKADPELDAYCEEMRRMVKQVEETVQLTPVEPSAEQPKLSEKRRERLTDLFQKPARKTIKLISPAGRARRISTLQKIGAIAAAIVILSVVVGTLISPKFSGQMAMFKMEPSGQLIDQLGGEPGAGSISEGLFRDDQPNSVLPPGKEADTGVEGVQANPDERFVARYGLGGYGSAANHQEGRRKAVVSSTPPPATSAQEEPGITPNKPTIYLPAQNAPVDDNALAFSLPSGPSYNLDRGVNLQSGQQNDFFYETSQGKPSIAQPDRPSAPLPALQFVPDKTPNPVISAGQSIELPKGVSITGFETADGRSKAVDVFAQKSEAKPANLALDDSFAKAAEPKPVQRRVSTYAEPAAEPMRRSAGRRAQAEERARERVESDSRDAKENNETEGLGVAVAGGVSGTRPSATSANVPGIADSNAAEITAGTPIDSQWDIAAGKQLGHEDSSRVTEDKAKADAGYYTKQTSERKLDDQADSLASGPAPKLPPAQLREREIRLFREPAPPQASVGKDVAVKRYDSLQRDSNGRNEVPGQVKSELRQQVDNPEWVGVLGKKEPMAESAEPAQSAFPNQSLSTAESTPSRAAVPIVGDAPVLGRLFKTEAKQETETRTFRVNPNTFYQGMEGVLANSLGGGVNNGQVGDGSVFAQVSIAPSASQIRGGEIGGSGGFGGGGGGGIRFLTTTNGTSAANIAARDYLEAAGVNLNDSSKVFYNDRTGMLSVKAPRSELEKVQNAVEMLNYAEPSTSSRFDALADKSEPGALAALDKDRAQQAAPLVESSSAQLPEVKLKAEEPSAPAATPAPPSTIEPLPEISTTDNPFSTFSLNVSDVSFQLAASSLANGQMPDSARLRSEEFINAFDYHDPMPAPGQRVAFAWDRARNPFAHNRELLRFSVQTAAAGREPGQPLNLVLLLDNSGSMERSDRVHITEEMLRVLAAELTGYDRVSVIAFARTPRLIVDGMPGGNADNFLHRVLGLNPDGGTNLEEAMKLAYATAAKHYLANANNRVILITDGAANLGNIDPQALRDRVIEQRKKGIALDCFGVGWEGYNDNLLEQLSRNGDGRYGFLNDADQAPAQFASQLAGALQVAAADVKAQVEFNPGRVTVYRQIGYQQHQLTKEQFRDNTVDAAEISAAEAGNALYSVEVNSNGSGPIGTFRVRYRVPSTGQYEEKEWPLEYTADATDLESAPPAMRLASSAAAFAEWLANSPYAQTVTPDALQKLLRGVPEVYAPDPRPAKLQTMIQEARSISGK